jgi:Ala-tRNA(Pro) deacylase
MAIIASSLRQYLDERKVKYETLHHRRDYTAQETAADTGTPGREFAKVVMMKTDKRYLMAVLPAHHRVNMAKLKAVLGSDDLRLGTEDEIAGICPDCSVGAEHPFGNLYEIPVYVSKDLADDEWITFNAGTHEDVVRMRYDDYQRLVQPRVVDFSIRP